MDETDRLIVEALRADGRMSMRALADLVHISRANAYARVSRLEREGVRVTHLHFSDQIHGFMSMGRIIRAAGTAIDMMAVVLGKALWPPSRPV